MENDFNLELRHGGQCLIFPLSREIVLGRQLKSTEPIMQLGSSTGGGEQRLAVAPYTELRVSRRQVVLTPIEDRVLILNPSANPVVIDKSIELGPGTSWKCDAACEIAFGPAQSYTARIFRETSYDSQWQTLGAVPVVAASGQPLGAKSASRSKLLPSEAQAVRTWLLPIIDVLESAASSDDFLQHAARGVVELIGLDFARVLLFANEQWSPCAEYRTSTCPANLLESHRILNRVRSERQTVWTDNAATVPGDHSQTGLQAAICAPISNRQGEVIGALYAVRHGITTGHTALTPAEVTLAEALAYGIAVGLERVRHEARAVEQRVLLDQFFTRELAEHITANPALLEGKDALVTVLMADIRGFSSISERLPAAQTLQWIQDTLDALTDVVLRMEGTLVDYIGDELLAMWGAPVPQADQARRACQAALEMKAALVPVNERWREKLKAETEVAIGIHTGVAQVGNTGSRKKFKYGALGHTVNLASRVQGANKHLRTSLLVTKATHDQLGGGFLTRRIGTIEVVNIEQPLDVFELRPVDDERGRMLCELYDKALSEFEKQSFRRAARTLGSFIPNYEDDGPSHILLWRSVNGLVHPTDNFSPAWKLPGK